MKIFKNREDNEDYEQELAIREWLRRNGSPRFDFTSINSKGNSRHIGDMGSFSLDEKIANDDGCGTYADIIAGSDGRDMESGEACNEDDNDSLGASLEMLLISIGVKGGVLKWAKVHYRASGQLNLLR